MGSRMARMAKLLRSTPELLILIKGIGVALRSVFFTLILVLLLLYVFAIYFRMMTEGDIQEAHFSKITFSMHTLLMYGTFLDSLGEVSFAFAESAKESFGDYINLILWYVFILLSSLMPLNMLIGILCEVITAVAETERESIEVEYTNDKFAQIVSKAVVTKPDMFTHEDML